MKTIDDIINIIADALEQTAISIKNLGDYKIVVSQERAFNNDYERPDESELLRENNEYEEINYDDPLDVPGQKKIIILIKFGQGQINKALLNLPVSIQCLSEQGDFMAAATLLRKFCNDFNFEYYNGLIMSFFTPEIMSAAEQVYSGYRALMGCKGTIKVPEDGLIFVTEVWSTAKIDNETKWFKVPFINIGDNWVVQTDPQAFSGFNGRTMNMNRQGTASFSINCYLWNYTNVQINNAKNEEEANLMRCLNSFSRKIIVAPYNINVKFRLYFKTNIEVSEGDYGWDQNIWDAIKNSSLVIDQTSKTYYMPSYDGFFTLANRTLGQPWGDIVPWSVTFTESKEEG